MILLYRKQYTHLKVLQLRYCSRDSIIQVRIDLIFIMVPLGEQKQMEEVETYKTSCRYVTYSRYIAHTFPVEKGRWWPIPIDQRVRPLCLGNLIGNEKHYIVHCTNDKSVEIRKGFGN